MAPIIDRFFRRGSNSSNKNKSTPTLQDGLFRIGCQAYHILVHDSNDNPIGSFRTSEPDPSSNKPLVVIIPTSSSSQTNNQHNNKNRSRFSVSIFYILNILLIFIIFLICYCT